MPSARATSSRPHSRSAAMLPPGEHAVTPFAHQGPLGLAAPPRSPFAVLPLFPRS
ncbi:MAG TPA: hypothetical protein VGO26_06110 [Amnibacterium sp.]|jgi:hypothetical protein|nr:hypothetical protein [Amnibacterium sp.]